MNEREREFEIMKNQKATQPSKAAKPSHPNLLSTLEGKGMIEAALRLAVRLGYLYNTTFSLKYWAAVVQGKE